MNSDQSSTILQTSFPSIWESLKPKLRLLRPPPDRASWQWAKEKRILPKESAEPGPFNPGRTPWCIGISEANNNPATKTDNVVMGRQMCKTEGLLNEIGHKMDDDPRPILYVGPTEKNVNSMSNDRVTKMLHSTESLYAALSKGHKNKTSEKFINGVRLGFAWAGSPTELASHPCAMAIIDERDRMGPTSEGDVDTILNSSVSTYDGIIIRTSTPLEGEVSREDKGDGTCDHWGIAEEEDISSPIWRHWQNGSRHEWAVPCPHCREYFIPWSGLLMYDEKLSPEEIEETAYLACPNNGCEIHSDEKQDMNARGVFVAPDEKISPLNKRHKAATIDGVRVMYGCYLDQQKQAMSFWVSGLMSPWRSFGNAARGMALAKKSGDPKVEQGFFNTELGELYKHKGIAVDWQIVAELKEGYLKKQVPEGVKVLTLGVDTHKERLNFVVTGWGAGYESWRIDVGELFGQTRYIDDITWRQLTEILHSTYDGLPVGFGLIDAGYKPNDDEPAPSSTVYQFCYKSKRLEAAKGHDYRTRPYSPAQIDVTYNGKIIKGGLRIWHLDTDFFKSFIYSRLEWPEGQPGGWHLPSDIEDEYCRQLVAEQKIVLPSGKPKWKKIKKHNHFLDCEMMATGAAHILRLHNLSESDKPKPAKRTRKVHRGLQR